MKYKIRFLLALIIGSIVVINCTKVTFKEEEPKKNIASCEGCHTDYATLKLVYTPDTAAPVGGCGGDAPHFEPYDRVFMGNTGYEAYKTSSHYQLGCVTCHNGVDNTSDKATAHSGDFIKHPSMFAEDKCGGCHETTVNNFPSSLHNGTGQKRKVTLRSGLSGHTEFDQLPASHKEGYNNNCAHCHGTCGNCHVVRPATGGGGLLDGHNFAGTPDWKKTCNICHVSRGRHAYLGVAPGTQPDVHLTENGFECLDCHSGMELHGTGDTVEQRYAYAELPSCDDCHTGIASANTYHTVHYDDFNCQVCHSQDYNNCGSCHIHGEGARVPAYLGFKIAMNPIPDVKTEFEFALVRRTLAAPDNWKEYGVPQYANFDVLPTYNYTTPHNILRWTDRTDVETGGCSSNCHLRIEGNDTINKGLFLFEKDLLDFEKTASAGIVVDGELPASWTNK